MRALLSLIILGLSSVACSSHESSQIASAKVEVAKGLLDPASAQFRNVRLIKESESSELVCGEVNGKNAFGAYVGFRKFAWASGLAIPWFEDQIGEQRQAFERVPAAARASAEIALRSAEAMDASYRRVCT